jgi:hypothetical protein
MLKTTEWSFDTFVEHEVKGMPLKVKLGNSIKGDKDFDKVASWFNPQLSFISQQIKPFTLHGKLSAQNGLNFKL